jgi:hypothetical protein
MADLQALVCLRADLEKLGGNQAVAGHYSVGEAGWIIEPWPLTDTAFFVAMKARDGESYTMRLSCDGYPQLPPSIACVDSSTHDQQVRKAWPECEGFRPTNDLCMNISREGLLSLHPDWQKDPRYMWCADGNPIEAVLWALQDRLLSAKYVRRCQ